MNTYNTLTTLTIGNEECELHTRVTYLWHEKIDPIHEFGGGLVIEPGIPAWPEIKMVEVEHQYHDGNFQDITLLLRTDQFNDLADEIAYSREPALF